MAMRRHKGKSKFHHGRGKSPRPTTPATADGRNKSMLTEFQNFNKDRASLDDLVALAAFGRLLRTEYEAQKVDEPAFVDLQLKTLRREIAAKVDDKRQARRKHLEAQIESLKTPVERRKALEKELAEMASV